VDTEQTLLQAFDCTITADVNLVGDRAQENERFGFLTRFMRAYILAGIVSVAGMDILEQWNKARRAVYLRIQRRRFFITSSGRFGLGPRDTKDGDVVFVLFGCNVPVVLRQNGDRWTFVGEAFVTGIMDGEVVEAAERNVSSDGGGVEHASWLMSILIS